jgi:hypothetical protein
LRFFDFISNLDKRWVFLLMAVVVTVPFFCPFGLPIEITPHVKAIYDKVEEMAKEGDKKPILISADFGPEAIPELYPMLLAFLRQCFEKHIKIILMTLHPAGPGIAEQAVKSVAKEYGYDYGKDYVFLGFGVGNYLPMINIGKDIKMAFPTDFYGTPTLDIPMLQNVKNYRDIAFVYTLAGSIVTETWIVFARSQFNASIAAGVTGAMASDTYPFLKSGQLFGLVGGLKGAAEYETLINHKDEAYRGMDSQSAVHILIVVLVILGNIAYFLQRKTKEKR